ncbi:hypothetical protein GQ43DRAFT_455135 [Delitschia confertaspora ATCC 74209]|uniref:CSN8/PSMD8/EIF3K domain-containing protein n=1 Tax=Delitschia confertaspora ATCC 74209 TaxID=1513339 RepID=A0A9P4JSB1_9PLEO|nr:hypothetical protein GQ43DRAFT_455135 [Delitschia confertaspora ATCC 74209]
MRSTEQRPSSSRRGASGAWNRLKPVRDDPLETYGLPSKGENRLNDFKAQELYYNKIVERYMKFCAASSGGDDLNKQFASLKLRPSTSSIISPPSTSESVPIPPPVSGRPSQASGNELATIIASLRKLREAITATSRRDHFAQRAYIFNIHAAILCKDWESYSPALLSLLNVIHPQTPLPSAELHEYVGYLILDLACRQSDITAAYTAKLKYGYTDRRVELVLKALVSDNWVVFWKMKRAVDGYQRRIMEYAEQEMRLHALKCLGRAYMSADRQYVERCADRRWPDLLNDGVGWQLEDGDKVIIRTPKVK